MDFGVNGQVAIVTGGASGIGRGVSEAFASSGAKVVLTYFESEAGANETVAGIEAAGGEARAIKADLTKPEDAQRVVAETVAKFGRVDIVVANSGGLLKRSALVDTSLEFWNEVFAVNVTSTFLICQAAIPELIKAGGGSIVTMGSMAAHDGGGANAVHYAASKGAILTFTKALAKQVAPDNIRVNSVAPGLIGTQFHDEFNTPEGRASVVSRTPIQREGTPEDVAASILFLASPRASFITGETIQINGGQSFY
ncbi:SDR family NAD(P)-dependent oxidoreductase [soil metagenome]